MDSKFRPHHGELVQLCVRIVAVIVEGTHHVAVLKNAEVTTLRRARARAVLLRRGLELPAGPCEVPADLGELGVKLFVLVERLLVLGLGLS